jgi:hypothetical protein
MVLAMSRSISGTSGVILASLFRTIMHEIGINHEKFNYLMLRYLDDPRNHIPRNIKDRSTVRGNLKKQLLKNTMTWKVFNKAMMFLNIRTIELVLLLEHQEHESEHRLAINPPLKQPGMILSEFYQQILADLNIDNIMLEAKIDNYCQRLNALATGDETLKNKSKVKRETTNSSISWKVFSRGLFILEIKKLTIVANVLHANNRQTVHKLTLLIQ